MKYDKKELLKQKIEHIDIKKFNSVPLIESFDNMAFQSRNLARACKIYDKMLKDINPSLKMALDGVRRELEIMHNAPAYEVIAAERHHLALKIFEESSHVERGKRISWAERVDSAIMQPFLGYVVLAKRE